MSADADSVQSLRDLLGNGRLHRMLKLAARIGQASGAIDPFAGLDRQELREWHDQVLTALKAAQTDQQAAS